MFIKLDKYPYFLCYYYFDMKDARKHWKHEAQRLGCWDVKSEEGMAVELGLRNIFEQMINNPEECEMFTGYKTITHEFFENSHFENRSNKTDMKINGIRVDSKRMTIMKEEEVYGALAGYANFAMPSEKEEEKVYEGIRNYIGQNGLSRIIIPARFIDDQTLAIAGWIDSSLLAKSLQPGKGKTKYKDGFSMYVSAKNIPKTLKKAIEQKEKFNVS